MHFAIHHHTRYRYSQPVRLAPQWLRFHPRNDGSQRVLKHQLRITPSPLGRNLHLDLEGNQVTQVWFEGETQQFEIEIEMEIETLRSNPFDFILAPEAMTLPIQQVLCQPCARAYLERHQIEPAVTEYVTELRQVAGEDSLDFLDGLNRQLFRDFSRVIRDTGEPQSPAVTLQSRRGACRDLSVLFVDCCRAQGIPARFVSGYQKGDGQRARRYLHAWPEIYLPGAGWLAYDPTHGEIVSDTHVTIAAAAHPRDTMPVTGGFYGEGISSELDFTLNIEVAE